MTDPNPRGVRVIHEGPGAPIQICMWWMDGRRESVWTSDKALHVFMADLAQALSLNCVDQPRRPDAGETKEN